MQWLWVLAHIGLIAGFLLALAIVAHVLRNERSPSGTIAWLLVILLLPYVGVPLYLLLGGRKMQRIAASKRDLNLADKPSGVPTGPTRLQALLRSYGIPGATQGNRIRLCANGEEAYQRLVDLIESARSSIWIETFILHLDETGRDIVQRLVRRAREGLEVRVLLDGVGSLHTPRRALRDLLDAGGRVEHFIPVLHRPFRGRTNLRNHRKIMIADQRHLMAGGANIALEYMGPEPHPDRWRDLMFVLEGPAVAHYADVFRADWHFASGEELAAADEPARIAGQATVQVVPSGPDVMGDTIYAALLTAIFAAHERIWVVTPYFVPNQALEEAFVLAAHRGVDVRLIIPRESNHPVADVASRTYLRDIQAAGGKIHLYQNGMMHGKALLMDRELAIIGSANVDSRSLFLNYEAALFVYSAPDIRQVERWIERTLVGTRVGVDEAGPLREYVEGLTRIISPLL